MDLGSWRAAVFAKPEFPILIFIAGVLFFGWPLMDIARSLTPVGRLVYFFGGWALLVLAYFLLFRGNR
ncbi:MAG: hypothetical protein ACI9W6_000744 [Motiliproteus sp.]